MKATHVLTMAVMAFVMSTTSVLAQSGTPQDRPQQVEKKPLTEEQLIEMRTQRMQQELLLDDATAAQFAPLYAEYLKALRDCRKEVSDCKAAQAKEKTEKKALTDAEIRKRLEAKIRMQCSLAETKAKYFDRFSKLLSARQLEKLFDARPSHRGEWHHKPEARRGHVGKMKGKRNQPQACPMAPAKG